MIEFEELKKLKKIKLAMELLEAAEYEVDEKIKLELLEKGLNLAPDNLFVRVTYEITKDNFHKAVLNLEKLALEYVQKIESNNIEFTDYNDNELAFFEFKKLLILYYSDQLLFKEAEKHALELLKFDNDGNLQAKHLLMAIYVRSLQHKKAYEYFNTMKEINEKDDHMLFYLVVSLILDKNDYNLDKYLSLLILRNGDNFCDFFLGEEFDAQKVEEYLDKNEYNENNSKETIVSAIEQVQHLFAISEYLYYSLSNRIKELLAPKETMTDQEVAEWAFQFHKNKLYNGLGSRPKRILIYYGYTSKGDFANITEKELLAIEGIGITTVKKLKANGVKFSQDKAKKNFKK